MNSRLVSISYYDRLPGLGAKPILYRAIILKVIVFAVIELYHYNKWKHSSLKKWATSLIQIVKQYWQYWNTNKE